VVERLLEREPARRYGSAAEATTELRRLQETIQVPFAAATTAVPVTATTPVAPATAPLPPPQEPRQRSATGWIVAAIIILALAVGGLVAWAVTRDDTDEGDDVIVPAVVGLQLAQAESEIRAAGLDVSTINENNDEFGPGIVFSQAPQPTTTARRGSVVVLKVSAGPTTTTSTSTTSSSTTTSTTTTTTTTTTQPPTTSST
jgi:serine/threonine-protein kinase